MTSTVTIPLQEYDRLKDLEKELKEIKANDFYCIQTKYGMFYSEVFRIKEKDEALKLLSEEFKDKLGEKEAEIYKLKNRKFLGLFKI